MKRIDWFDEVAEFWSKLLWTPKKGDYVAVRYRNRNGEIIGQSSKNVYAVRLDNGEVTTCVFSQEMRQRHVEMRRRVRKR